MENSNLTTTEALTTQDQEAKAPSKDEQYFINIIKYLDSTEDNLETIKRTHPDISNAEIKFNNGSNLMHFAGQIGSVKAINTLQQLGYKMNSINNVSRTPLHEAAMYGHVKAIQKLKDLGADIKSKNNEGCTPLHLAAMNEEVEAIQKLKDLGADINSKDNEDYTPIHLAALNGHVEAINLLKDLGADIKSKNNEDCTPIHLAALYGHVDAIQKLKDLGADINARNYQGSTPLHLAAMNGHVDAIQKLKDLRADINSTNNEGCTPLHFAIMNGHVDAIKLLKDLGADVNARNNQGHTPLHFAIMNGHVDAIKLLKDLGADINARNYQGSTPLHLATRRGKIGAIQKLKDLGADVNAKNDKGDTPLHLACRFGQMKIIEWFYDNSYQSFSIGINLKNDHTPICEAIRYSHFDTANLILSKIPNQYKTNLLSYLLYIIYDKKVEGKSESELTNLLQDLVKVAREKHGLVLNNLQIPIAIGAAEAGLSNEQKLKKYVETHPYLALFIAHGVKFDLPEMPELQVAIDELYRVGETYLDAVMSNPSNTLFANILTQLRSNPEILPTVLFSNSNITEYLSKRFIGYSKGQFNYNLIDVLADTILTEKYPQAKSLDEAKACYIVEKLGKKILDLYTKDAAQAPDERTIALRKNSLLAAIVPIILQHKDSFAFPVLPAQLEILLVARGLNALQNEASKRHPNFKQSFKNATESAFQTWKIESANPDLVTLKNNCRKIAENVMNEYNTNVAAPLQPETQRMRRNHLAGWMYNTLSSVASQPQVKSDNFLANVQQVVLDTMIAQSTNSNPNFKKAVEASVQKTLNAARPTTIITLPATITGSVLGKRVAAPAR